MPCELDFFIFFGVVVEYIWQTSGVLVSLFCRLFRLMFEAYNRKST